MIKYLFYLFLQLSWGLFQNIAAFLLAVGLFFFGGQKKWMIYHGAVVVYWRYAFSMGLGMFIFCNQHKSETIMVHEWGHTVQSAALGPFFLFLVGFPSLIWSSFPYFRRYRRLRHCRYTALYCESWASKIGQKYLGKKAFWG